MSEKQVWQYLLDPTPNTILLFVILADVAIIFISATTAVTVPLLYPENRPNPSGYL